ncbi:MAG: OmpA family protein [Flavitalea sp.]
MNHKIIMAILLASVTTGANAQLRGFAEKVKNKVVQKATHRADSKIDKEIDKSLDEIEGKGTKSNTNSGSEGNTESSGSSKSGKSLKSNSKFDFIPGDSILYSEDFSQDVIGEMPLGWNSTGKSEIVTLDKIPGKWMKLYQNSVYLSSNKATFPKNFTLEFDLILQLTNTGYTYPLMKFGIFSSSDEESHDNKFLEKYKDYQWVDMMIRPSTGNSYMQLQTHVDRKGHFKGTDQQLSDLHNSYNTRSVHIAMQGQGARLRVWIDQDKIYDIPQALPSEYSFNQLFFNIGSSAYKEEEANFYITNLKLATGVPDTRHKLIEEGKLSTTAILFDVNTANLKPESFGIIKEIGNVLKQNEDVKISIVGHTDSDGKDDANLSLSEKRAAAVKEALVKDFGIDEVRIQTSGKGESQPLGDNKTKEGKAQNRRVEFIKL